MSSLLIRGFVLGFAIAASPGPIFFLCLRRTLVRGWLNGVVSGLGVATADGFYAALAAFGIGAVTSALVGERRWLALIGGAVLIVLGLRTLLDRPNPDEGGPPSTGSGLTWAYMSTLGLTFYTGTQLPARYRGGVFVAYHGSESRSQATGYKVVFMKPKDTLTTIASYDDWVLKNVKGASNDTRPTSSVIRTISE